MAWQKASRITGLNPAQFRMDRFGMTICYSEYGKCTAYGWEIDHVVPLSWGGIDGVHNEVATHWRMNRAKSNNFIG
jgi:hypothetical protein